MITSSDYQFVSHYDRQNHDEKDTLFEKEPEQVNIFLHFLLRHVNLYHLIEFQKLMFHLKFVLKSWWVFLLASLGDLEILVTTYDLPLLAIRKKNFR